MSDVTRSLNKSAKLQELEHKISPPARSIADLVDMARHPMSGAQTSRDHAMEEFLDLCEGDPNVRKVMQVEGLSRRDLEQLYARLLVGGLGQWIDGHYAALSTIAYAEPLQYATRAQKHGVTWLEVLSNLLLYWQDRIPQGALLERVR